MTPALSQHQYQSCPTFASQFPICRISCINNEICTLAPAWLLSVWPTLYLFLLQALLLHELIYWRVTCQMREERLQDCKAVSHQRCFAPWGVWGMCLCCRAAWWLLPNMTWCTSLIPHHIISHYFCLIHRHWLIPRDMHLPIYFSLASPLPTFFLCSFTSASLQVPTELYQVTESQADSSNVRFDSIQKWNLNTECPLFLLHGFHLKPWPWRLERTKRSGSLGCLHAISYSFSNPHQTSFVHALSLLNYKSDVRPAEGLSLSSFHLQTCQEGKWGVQN